MNTWKRITKTNPLHQQGFNAEFQQDGWIYYWSAYTKRICKTQDGIYYYAASLIKPIVKCDESLRDLLEQIFHTSELKGKLIIRDG